MTAVTHRKKWTRYGEGVLTERRVFGVWFFREYQGQQWSPVCNDGRTFYGIRIGRWRFGFDVASIRWSDGKEPAIEKRLMP